MAGVIAMSSALVVVGIEMFLTTRGAKHSHSHGGEWDEGHPKDSHRGHQSVKRNRGENTRVKRFGQNLGVGADGRPQDITLHNLRSSDHLVDDNSVSSTPAQAPEQNNKANYHDTDDDDDNDSDLDLDELDATASASGLLHNTHHTPFANDSETQLPGLHGLDDQKRLLLQCLLLEAGILFHSVFIGIALSVATGPPFYVFLTAISFHQSFEGLALGSRIAAINFPSSSPRPWLMVLAYGTTTPIGQAIGLVIQRWYDPQSMGGLLVVGVMNAVSSGLLLFAGLVQLLSEDFLSEGSYVKLQGKRRWHAFAAVIGGAVLMALVGAWA